MKLFKSSIVLILQLLSYIASYKILHDSVLSACFTLLLWGFIFYIIDKLNKADNWNLLPIFGDDTTRHMFAARHSTPYKEL